MKQTVRARALVGGMVSGVILCGLTPFADAYLKTTPLGGGQFPLAPFVCFFAATVILALLGRLQGRKPLLTGTELLVAWGLMVIVSGIGFTGLVRTFFFNITTPAQFAGSGNGWSEGLLRLLPSSLYPDSAKTIANLYTGLPDKTTLGVWEVLERIPWHFWLPVLARWSVFILLVYATLFFLANLFSNQWVVNERINFPLLQMPKLLADAYDERRLFAFLRDPYILTGISIPVLLHTLGGLNAHFPSVPSFPTEILAGSYFPPTGILSGLQKLKIYIYPAFIGFAFIATKQVSLSFWFFFLFAGILTGVLHTVGIQIPETALGTLFGPTISQPEELQVIGGSIVFFAFTLWLSRSYLGDVVRQCLGRGGEHDEISWIPARYSLIGALAGISALCYWSTAYGMGLTAAVLLYISFFSVMLLVAKIVCQGGIPYCTINVAPSDGIISIFGSGVLGKVGLVLGMSLQKMLFVDVREALLPSLIHTEKITEQSKARTTMAIAVAISLIAAVAVSFVSMLYLGYRYGLQDLDMDWATRTTQLVYQNSHRLLDAPQTPNGWALSCIAAGGLTMLVLVLCYYLLPWWPIHPIGYLMAYSSSMRILWFSFLVGWLCNTLCLRYGGTFLYRRLRLFFIGLIIGDFCMGGLWAIVSLYTGISYQVLPS